jgi:type 1 glutamine amidotransferase
MLLALVLSASSPAPQSPPPIRALVVAGANNHDWRFTTPEIAGTLAETGRFTVAVTETPATTFADAAAMADVDVLVLNYNGPRWGDAAERGFLAAVKKGTGVTVIHAANNAFEGWAEYEQLVGLLWRQGTGHGAYHPFDVHVVDAHHPITAGMADLRRHPDELYHRLAPGKGAEFRVLLAAYADPAQGGSGRFEPMATVARFHDGRVFHTPLGHTWTDAVPTRATWLDPQFRRLVARGTEWAATGTVTLAPAPLNWLTDEERAQGFERLFDGRSLDHWRAYRGEHPPAQGWIVRDAAIVHLAGGGGGDLVTREEFGDFDFRFSFRTAPSANSGVIWHVLETEGQTYMTGPEYQVLDDQGAKPDPKHAAGALYDLVPATGKDVRPAGAWNEGRIVIENGRVQHWLNGKLVVDAPCRGPEWDAMVRKSKFRDWPFGKTDSGRIALQDHGDEVAYRDLRIRRIGSRQ